MRPFIAGMTLAVLLTAGQAFAEGYAASTNFTVRAHTEEFAERVAETAEELRYKLAVEWLGSPLPGNWSSPCEITVKIESGSGGQTSFRFDKGEVFGWTMTVQGTEEGIINDVLPHEVNHTIFASHFRRPLPRWLDEGAAMLVETPAGVKPYVDSLDTPRTFEATLNRKEYPQDQTVIALYGQGYLMTRFLVERSTKEDFVCFVQSSHEHGWDHAFREHYGFDGVADADRQWRAWLPTYERQQPYQRSEHSQQGPRQDQGRTKPEMMVFTAPWCTPCQAWKNQYYNNPRFRRAVDAKYYVTFHDVNDRYAQQYGFKSIPAFVVNGRTIHEGYTNERAWFKGVGIGIGPVGIGAGVVVPPRPFIPGGNEGWEPDDGVPQDDIDEVDWNAVTLVLAVNTKIPLFTEKRAANVDRIEQRIRQATLENGVPVNVRVLSRVLDQSAYDQFCYDAGVEDSLVNRVHPVVLVPRLAGGGLKGFAIGRLAGVIEKAVDDATPLTVISERDEELRYEKCRAALYAYAPDMGDYQGERFGGFTVMDLILIIVTALAVAKLNLLEMLVGFLQGIRSRINLPHLEWDR